MKGNMKKILMFLLLLAFTGACSGYQVKIGKKCMEKDEHIVYSYIWFVQNEHPADTETCKKIEKK